MKNLLLWVLLPALIVEDLWTYWRGGDSLYQRVRDEPGQA